MMLPYLIEVPAEYLDLAKDTLKIAVVATVYALLQQYLSGAAALDPTELATNLLYLAAGLAVYYMVMPSVLRFVVKVGDEKYYHTLQKYR